jgi:PadR family transcriptional regulator, regulatory protein PadR
MINNTEMTILVALSHGEQYGREILATIAKLTARLDRIALGGLYTTLNRMEGKGLIKGRWADDDERDGARRRYYVLTGEGARELAEARALLEQAARRPAFGGA